MKPDTSEAVDKIVESYPSLDKKDVIAILEQACERIKAEAEPIRSASQQTR